MRILLAIAQFDYGKPELGPSYEHSAWVTPLARLGHEVSLFDTFGAESSDGPEAVGAALERAVRTHEPELTLMMLLNDEVDLRSVDRIRENTIVANWFSDDTWRFNGFSRKIAHHFDWVVTTSQEAHERYQHLPGVRAYYRPWGYNADYFCPVQVDQKYDVGFIGQRYGRRGQLIEQLESTGLSVLARGGGWPAGRIEQADLAFCFSKTKINLSFLESSAGPLRRRGLLFRGSWKVDQLFNRYVSSPPKQLKARPFEITGCGAFVLTNVCPELSDFFRLEEEVGTFQDDYVLLDRIHHYLEREDEREAIARAGFERAQGYSWDTVLRNLLADAMG